MSTAVLCIDAGNTRVKVALVDGDGVDPVGREDTRDCDASSIAALIADVDPTSVRGCVVASVVRGVGATVKSVVEDRLGLETTVLTAEMPLGIGLRVPSPETVGIDRLIISSQAYAISKRDTVVVGVGTAVTVDAVTADGWYVGGTISPGLRTATWSLSERTSLLPEIEDFSLGAQLPSSTAESIKMGVLVGTGGAIDGLISDLSRRASLTDPDVMLTGGDAATLDPYVTRKHTVSEDLLMHGLGRIHALLGTH